MMTSGLTGKNRVIINKENIQPPKSFYDLQFTSITGISKSMNEFMGKKVMIVNTASGCGYTDQFRGLQALYDAHKDELEIIAFPSNDFKHQEKLSNQEIAGFCSSVYRLNFTLAQKTIVRKKEDQHPVYQWLTNKNLNGWNDQPPAWNFSKFLINEKGVLTHYFDAGVDPVSQKVVDAVNET